ncbi:hypothetical protein ZWY2020_016694 [Hordeum vulgare]|nr:hypothetical protein ZWY2020_016694 [Hordeum vulgare]
MIGFKSRYHIDTEITEADGFTWRFTGIYGEPKVEARGKTWLLLRTLKQQSDKPWLCIGDFNEILHSWEKEGGAPKPQQQIDRFKEALEFCELDDLGFVGNVFTWRNHSHSMDKYVRERLDRVVATPSWRQRFLAYKVINSEPRHSDHMPVIVDTHGGARWLEEEDCKSIVENSWARRVQVEGEGVMSAVKGVLGELTDWIGNTLGDLEKRISRVKKELEKWRKMAISPEQVRKEQFLRFKLSRLKEQKEMYWKQRAHAHWLREVDCNTKFFHSFASEGRRLIVSPS